MLKRFTTVAGKTILVRYTDSSRIHTEKGRRPKTNPTPAAVRKVNRLNQERKLTALLNHNFSAGDMWLVFAYPDGTTPEEAMKEIEKFKRRLRNQCRREGIPLRIVEAMGIGTKKHKPHHHIVINKEVGREMILKFWPEEYLHTNYLWSGGNYQKIANYMIGNAQQTADERGKAAKFKRAWRASRTVRMPETREEVMKREPSHDPDELQPRKGYYIDRDSVRIYEHPITGARCVEYIEISLEREPRLKRYYKGKAVRPERMYPEFWDEQISFEEMIRETEEWEQA